MKKLFFLSLLLVSSLGFGQTTTPNLAAPTYNFGYLPYEFAYQLKEAIRDKYKAAMQNPTGADKVLVDNIETQMRVNGVDASNRTYSVSGVEISYCQQMISKYANSDYIKAQKAIADYQKVLPLMQTIVNQRPLGLKQIFEMNNSQMKYDDIQPYLPIPRN